MEILFKDLLLLTAGMYLLCTYNSFYLQTFNRFNIYLLKASSSSNSDRTVGGITYCLSIVNITFVVF